METVDAHFEDVKPFSEVSVDRVKPTVQSQLSKGSPIVKTGRGSARCQPAEVSSTRSLNKRVDAGQATNRLRPSKWTFGRVEADGEHPDGRRCPLTLPTFIRFGRVVLAGTVFGNYSELTLRPVRFSNWVN